MTTTLKLKKENMVISLDLNAPSRYSVIYGEKKEASFLESLAFTYFLGKYGPRQKCFILWWNFTQGLGQMWWMYLWKMSFTFCETFYVFYKNWNTSVRFFNNVNDFGNKKFDFLFVFAFMDKILCIKEYLDSAIIIKKVTRNERDFDLSQF